MSQAEKLVVSKKNQILHMHLNTKKMAAFQPKPQEIWIVTDVIMQIDFPEKLKKSSGLKQVEILETSQGSGVRFVFERSRQWHIQTSKNGFHIVNTTIKHTKNLPYQGLVVLEDGILLKDYTLPYIQVKSLQSRQMFYVAISKSDKPWLQEVSLHKNVLIPTLNGFVKTSSKIEKQQKQVKKNIVKDESLTPKTLQPVTAPELSVIKDPYLNKAVLFTLPQQYVEQKKLKKQRQKERQKSYARALGSLKIATQRALHAAGDVKPLQTKNKPVPRAIQKQTVFLIKNRNKEETFYDVQKKELEFMIQAKTPQEMHISKLDRARTALVFGRANEAQAILSNLPVGADKMPKDDVARVLMGTAYVLRNKPQEALPLLLKPGGPEPHRQLWLAMAQEKTGAYIKAVENFKNTIKSSHVYPQYLQNKLHISYAHALLKTQDYDSFFANMKIVKDAAEDGQLPPKAKYLVSQAHIKLGNPEEGELLLAQVAEDESDPIAFAAKYDYVKLLASRGELTSDQLAEYLEELRRMWRGGELEKNILVDLGKLYIENKHFRQGLNRLKMFSIYYPDDSEIDTVTEIMTKTFLTLFEPEYENVTDELGFLGLYYDYRELTPSDERGDSLVENIGHRLEKVSLFERAIRLFERQLKYRTKDKVKKGEIALILATLYRKNEQFQKSLETLKKGRYKNMSEDIVRAYDLEETRILVHLGEYEKAIKRVQPHLDDAARDLLVDVAWASENWKAIDEMLAPMFISGEHKGFENIIVRSNFVRLAHAYTRMNEREKLLDLIRETASNLVDYPSILDAIAVFAADIQISTTDLKLDEEKRPMKSIAQQLLSFNKFERQYKTFLTSRKKEEEEREVYNKKIQLLELDILPPPPQ